MRTPGMQFRMYADVLLLLIDVAVVAETVVGHRRCVEKIETHLIACAIAEEDGSLWIGIVESTSGFQLSALG